MRKNIIALMLVLPLLFIFVVFSSGNIASIGVSVSAGSIKILNAPEDGTLRIDLAEYNDDFKIVAAVYPENAANKAYTFRIDEIKDTEFAAVSVDEDGTVHAYSVGSARVTVVSNDGGYTDSITVIVSSSKPYGMEVSLYAAYGGENLATRGDSGYTASVNTGTYYYETRLVPVGFAAAVTEITEGFAVIDENAGTIMLPFGGKVSIAFTVSDGADGSIREYLEIDAAEAPSGSGITVNGVTGALISVEKDVSEVEFYVCAPDTPSIADNAYIEDFSVEAVSEVERGYKVSVIFAAGVPDELDLKLTAGGAEERVRVSFEEFAFTVRSTLPVQGTDIAMLEGEAVTFYAVPAVIAADTTFLWEVASGTLSVGYVNVDISEDGKSCVVTADGKGTFTLIVYAYRNGVALDVYPVEIAIEVVEVVTSVQITNKTDVGLAMRTAVAEFEYDASGTAVSYTYVIGVNVYRYLDRVDALDAFEIKLSDPSIATVEAQDGNLLLRVKKSGEITVTLSWSGNETFVQNVRTSVTLDAVKGGILVHNSDEIFKATAAGYPVVLGADIMLGTRADGSVYSLDERKAMLGRMKSTYNIEYYKNTAQEDKAYVNYVLEFRNDLYGNGYYIDAEYFTHAVDGAGVPQIFMGPLYFVSYGEIASVAGQDNIAYLVRTDGVTLHNVTLLGCSDESLYDDGEYKLENLNNVGTTLEINADVNILNCRVRNGRNVVRVYGGNRNGNAYFINSLSENATGCDNERINVRIEGCIVSQGREFLVKVGANRALRANSSLSSTLAECIEPDLKDASGNAYKVQTNNYLDDEYFYKMYVMTDLTVADSVFETSGLFALGVESNFAGSVLYKDSGSDLGVNFQGWSGTGGTSFASVLRLKGDVRIYDWKKLNLIDSSTLIESNRKEFKFNIAAILDFVCGKYPDKYGDLLTDIGGESVVHGGIAFYGGGKNYSQLDMSGLNGGLKDFSNYLVNISVLKDSGDPDISEQGGFLPIAAGNQDFRFYMYGSGSVNDYRAQEAAASGGTKYTGIKAVSAFS